MGWYETDINGAPVVAHNGDTGDFHSTAVLSPSSGWGVVLLMNGSNGQERLDVPAYGVMAQLVGVPTPEMPSSLSEFTTLLNLALLAIIAVQIAAAGRSIFVLRRWNRNPLRQPRTLTHKIIRLAVPVLMSALWACVCVGVLPNVLNTPFTAMRFMDYGLLLLLSFTLALFWGLIIKPILGVWVLQNSSRPTKHEAAPEPKAPIPAGVQ